MLSHILEVENTLLFLFSISQSLKFSNSEIMTKRLK